MHTLHSTSQGSCIALIPSSHPLVPRMHANFATFPQIFPQSGHLCGKVCESVCRRIPTAQSILLIRRQILWGLNRSQLHTPIVANFQSSGLHTGPARGLCNFRLKPWGRAVIAPGERASRAISVGPDGKKSMAIRIYRVPMAVKPENIK